MRLGERIGARVKEAIASRLKPAYKAPDVDPEKMTFFNKAKSEFPPEGVSGVGGCTLYHATQKGAVSLGSILEITRKSKNDEDETNSLRLAYVGPAKPFLDPETGWAGHDFFDPRKRNGSSIVSIYDLLEWTKSERSLPREQLIRLANVLANERREAKRPKHARK